MRYSDIEGQRPYKNCTGCVIKSSSLWLYFFFFVSSSALMLFREEFVFFYFLKRVECPTIPNTWLLQYGCQRHLCSFNWLHIVLLCDNLDLNFHVCFCTFFFFLFFFTNVVSLLRMQMWASKSFPFICLKCGLYSKWPVYTWVERERERENSSSQKCSHHACVFV